MDIFSRVPSCNRKSALSRSCCIVPDVDKWRYIRYCSSWPRVIPAILLASPSLDSRGLFADRRGSGVEHAPVTEPMPGVDEVYVLDDDDVVCWRGGMSLNGPRDTSTPRCTVLSMGISFDIPFEYDGAIILSADKAGEARSRLLCRIS